MTTQLVWYTSVPAIDNYMKGQLLYPFAASLATLALHFFVGVTWGWAAFAGFVGWPLIGTLVTIDDDLPGGWGNPDGNVRPDWLTTHFWAQICLGLAIASFVAALDAGWYSLAAAVFVGAGVIVFALSVFRARRSGPR